MLLACRHAERVERMVVVDIAPKNYRWEAHRYEFLAMNELDLGSLQSRTEAELKFEARVPDLGMRKFLTTNLAQDDQRVWHWTIDLPVLTAALEKMENKFRGSTLFIAGGKSRYVEKTDKDAIWAHFPDARLEYIPSAGHNPHMDHRVEFVQLALGSVGYR
jgi:pimeloyl-ACP methyl ester carboxylesterase